MQECVDAAAYLFADDTTVFKDLSVRESIQSDLENLQELMDKWLLKFHPNKGKAVSISGKKCHNNIMGMYMYHLYNK